MRLIDADALVEDIKYRIKEDKEMYPDDKISKLFRVSMRTVINIIKLQDTVDDVKHGHWVKRNTVGAATCSICGAIIYDSYDSEANKYCHRCGARMDGDSK